MLHPPFVKPSNSVPETFLQHLYLAIDLATLVKAKHDVEGSSL